MDLNEIWQEHKRFIVTLCSAALLFFIGTTVVESVFGADRRAKSKAIAESARVLRDPHFTASDRRDAAELKEQLEERTRALEDAVAFVPRPGFLIETRAPAAAQNAFMDAGERLRSRLGDLASRRRAVLPDGLGIEMPGSRNVDVYERHLHALDLLERSLEIGLESGVRRVRNVRIELDRAFKTGRGLGPVERTEVTIEVEGDPEAVTAWIAACETPAEGARSGVDVRGQALPISSIEIRGASVKRSDLLATVTFLVVRIHTSEAEDA
ncbi:MAG: hypothetical protein AAFP22_07815 [Planctomycetota bacterium]